MRAHFVLCVVEVILQPNPNRFIPAVRVDDDSEFQ